MRTSFVSISLDSLKSRSQKYFSLFVRFFIWKRQNSLASETKIDPDSRDYLTIITQSFLVERPFSPPFQSGYFLFSLTLYLFIHITNLSLLNLSSMSSFIMPGIVFCELLNIKSRSFQVSVT